MTEAQPTSVASLTTTSSKAEKENAQIKQTTLQLCIKDTPSLKRKSRTLTVKPGEELDLESATLPLKRAVVEAMRKRIIELEDALEDQPVAKRSKTTKKTEDAPSTGSSYSAATASAKVDKKKVDVLLKKFWSSLQKEVKTEKYKFRGGDPKVCRIEEVVEEAEFHAIFDGKGLQTQPTATNKPTSTVTIKEFSASEIVTLFDKHFKELKGNRYSVGGILANFAKGEKIGLVELQINSLQISYAKNTMKCALKFEVEEATPYRLGLDEDFGDDGYYLGHRPARRRNYGWVFTGV